MAAAGIGRRRRKDGEEEGEEKRGDWLLKEPKNAEWLLSSCNRNRPFQFHVANNNAAASSFRPTHPDGKANLTQFSVMPDSGLLFSREEKLKFASRMLNRLLSSNKKVYTPTSNDRGSDPWLRSEPRRKSSVIQSIQNNIVIQDALCTSRAALTSSKIRSRADRNKYESPLPSPVQSLPPNVEQKLNITSLSVENHDQLAPSPGKTLESIHTQILRVRSPNKLEMENSYMDKHYKDRALYQKKMYSILVKGIEQEIEIMQDDNDDSNNDTATQKSVNDGWWIRSRNGSRNNGLAPRTPYSRLASPALSSKTHSSKLNQQRQRSSSVSMPSKEVDQSNIARASTPIVPYPHGGESQAMVSSQV